MPESRLAAIIAGVLAARGVPAQPHLPSYFRTDERVVFTIPELDPYRAYRREPMYLPPLRLPAFVKPPVTPALFVYLGDDTPHLPALAQALAELDFPVTAYLRGEVRPIPDFLTMRGHTVHQKPPHLADLLPEVSHVLSAGGAFTSHAALAAGRPHLVAPQHSESRMNLEMLEQLGVATELSLSADPLAIRTQIEAFIQDHGTAHNARNWAGTIAARQQSEGLAAALTAIHRLTRLTPSAAVQ